MLKENDVIPRTFCLLSLFRQICGSNYAKRLSQEISDIFNEIPGLKFHAKGSTPKNGTFRNKNVTFGRKKSDFQGQKQWPPKFTQSLKNTNSLIPLGPVCKFSL